MTEALAAATPAAPPVAPMLTPAAPPPAAPAAPVAATPAAPPPAAPAAPDPWFANPAFGLDQELKDYVGPKNFATPADAFKAMRQFETMARDRTAIPAPVPGKETEWTGWEKLGWVADRAKYAVDMPKMPDGIEYDAALHNGLLQTMHENRVPLPAAKALVDHLGNATAETLARAAADDAARVQRDMDALKTEWGGKFNENLEHARRVLRAYGSNDPAIAAVMDDLVGFAPVVKLLQRIGADLGEDKLVTGGGSAASPATARATRLRLEADPAFMAALNDPRNPLHMQMRQQREDLLRQEAGGR